MGDPAIGWIAAIIIGGIAGWLAEQFMKSEMGLLMNIVLGIVGSIGSAIFIFFGIALGGWLGYLISGRDATARTGATTGWANVAKIKGPHRRLGRSGWAQ